MSLLQRTCTIRRWAISAFSQVCVEQQAFPFLGRSFHSCIGLLAKDIVVPSMGDSITEGSIASVLKGANSYVEEDESILQIETDKVTIDVRAPVRGTLRAVLVRPDDVVSVGSVVAVLDEAKDGAPVPQVESAAPLQKPVDLDELTDAAQDISDSAMRGHKARIAFPPRRTADGVQISSMPAVDQQTYIARSASAAQTTEKATAGPDSRSLTLDWGAVGVGTGAQYIPRRTLADAEMESIMLGGADDM